MQKKMRKPLVSRAMAFFSHPRLRAGDRWASELGYELARMVAGQVGRTDPDRSKAAMLRSHVRSLGNRSVEHVLC